MRHCILLAALTALTALATLPAAAAASGPPPQAPEAAARDLRHKQCMGRMMSERVARGRTAPNWNLYDYCMKQPARR